MKLTRALACAVVLLVVAGSAPAKLAQRTRITAISGATILVSHGAALRAAYMRLLAPRYSCDFCEESPIPGFALGSGQVMALQGLRRRSQRTCSKISFFLLTT